MAIPSPRLVRRGLSSLVSALSLLALVGAPSARAATHSTSIDLDPTEKLLFNVNREANSVTVFRVGGKSDSGLAKLVEVPVGREPTCVAARTKDAFVTNSGSGTVSVIARKGTSFGVVAEIAVGAEPRGCVLSPDQKILYVTNFTDGTLSLIDTKTREVFDTVPVGGNPYAVAVGRDTVFVTRFFARLIAGGPGEGFDDGKEGVVVAFPFGSPDQQTEITLSPLAATGFTANRAALCKKTNAAAVNDTFCPNTDITDPADPAIAADPQGAFPNQLAALETCAGKLYVPSIGAAPEPPVIFNNNVQALVHTVDIASLAEIPELTLNLNAQIKTEAPPANPTQSLARLFGNDVVAMDADVACRNFLFVSRGGNYVLRAQLDEAGKLTIGAPDDVVRMQTGNIPTGVVIDRKGKRAYTNNEVNLSVSVLDVAAGGTIALDVPSATPPAPGSFENARLLGRLVFFTALGVPDDGLVGLGVRDVVPLQFRGKQSDNAWSSCASCHPDGLSDGVTWIFADGPRQTIPLDGLYSKLNGAHDARINNWSAARDSVTDFNNNSRNVQCGAGFAGGDPPQACNPASPGGAPNPNVFDHGIQQGASEALDLETTWSLTVRALNAPKPEAQALAAGSELFAENCASCHGGAKWTKSQVLYLSNPALNKGFAAGGTARDPGLVITANQSASYADGKVDAGALDFLEDVGTFSAASPIEIKQNGTQALGAAGFNVPSLLGVGSDAPYFHDGSAQTLEEVFEQHALGGGTIASSLGAGDQQNLLAFLRSIDGRTAPLRSQADDFHEPID